MIQISSIDEVPILVIGFNRPSLLAGLLKTLEIVRPKKLYLAIDGPRHDRPGEAQLVRECRTMTECIDWDCEIITLFHERNLGCGAAVSSALSWFFANEEFGIILEDDIRPNIDFFAYCSDLLVRYMDDARVFAIAGSTVVPTSNLKNFEASYRFSSFTGVWGWATWRRSWDLYEFEIEQWSTLLPISKRFEVMSRSFLAMIYWSFLFNRVATAKVDTWDYQLCFSQFLAGQFTATANINLVENVGFSSDATHTKDRPRMVPEVGRITWPLVHPKVTVDSLADRWQIRKLSINLVWLVFCKLLKRSRNANQ